MENEKNLVKEDLYDRVCEMCLINLYSLSKDQDGIYLANFNAKDKEHLFALHMAVHVANLLNTRIYIDVNFFTRIKLWRSFRRGADFFKKKKSNVEGIAVDKVLAFMRVYAEEHVHGKESEYIGNIFADIYDAYYNRKVDEDAI